MKETKEELSVASTNCFCWVRDKLRLLDIELGESWLELIATNPLWYVQSSEPQQESEGSET